MTVDERVVRAPVRRGPSVEEQINEFKLDASTLCASRPADELKREIEIFCDLFTQPAVEEGLRKFVENDGVQPYLP